MRRTVSIALAVALIATGASVLMAWRGGGGSWGGRGSVYGASGGSWSHSGGTSSWSGRYGDASGSRSVTQTGSGYDVNKEWQTQGGYSKDVNRDVNTQDGSVTRNSTATNPWGQSASRSRTATDEGGYASVSGSASTSTGRYASGSGYAGRDVYGQPAFEGTVNTKYNGSYGVAGARNPYGGWTTATAGPYGGHVTTTLPSGYRTTTYYGRSYYSYGGAYYRPYTNGGMHYYYPVPPPYYSYYEYPPVGAMMLAVAGTTYLVTKEASYAKQTTSSSGTIVYQAVPAPVGAQLKTLPAERVLVTVGGTTYYLCSNTFYRRVDEGAQEQFVVVTPPAGVVFVSALPADFKVENFNTMYFVAGGQYYVPFLSTDGKEMYVKVDQPPQPAGQAVPTTAAPAGAVVAGGPSPAAAGAAGAAAASPAVRKVQESLTVSAGTVIVVRPATQVASATAAVGNRFRGYLDQDVSSGGRFVVARGAPVYGMVTAASRRDGSLSVTLTDLTVGDNVVAITTQPLSVPGGTLAAQSPQAFTVAAPFQVQIMTSVAIRQAE